MAGLRLYVLIGASVLLLASGFGSAWKIQEWRRAEKVEKVRKEELQRCQDFVNKLETQNNAYQNKTSNNCSRASRLTGLVYSPAAGKPVPSETIGNYPQGEYVRLDRAKLAELIEQSRLADDNTAAAVTLDEAWPSLTLAK